MVQGPSAKEARLLSRESSARATWSPAAQVCAGELIVDWQVADGRDQVITRAPAAAAASRWVCGRRRRRRLCSACADDDRLHAGRGVQSDSAPLHLLPHLASTGKRAVRDVIRLFKVRRPTGSHVHAKSGSIEEMARDRHIVTINTTNTHTPV